MQIIGIHGKARSGKTTTALMLAGVLLDMGYAPKLDSMILALRRAAHATGVTAPELRRWLQNEATFLRDTVSPNYFINKLFLRNNLDLRLHGIDAEAWEPADFLIIHDVRMQDEVKFCRRHGVVIHCQGVYETLDGSEAEHKTELEAGELFYGADYIIPKQPSRELRLAAVKALVAKGDHLKKESGERSPA
jgi:hypothetical protein